MLTWWQFLLFPFAILYDLITRFRNYLYNIDHKKSFSFEANLIAVGNLAVGGTGKTPMVAYLIEHFLSEGKSVATLSRGYGRKTKGFRLCTAEDSPETVGDEPYTYFESYGEQILVTVCEDRALAIPFILTEKPDVDVILLDDAYQHRSVRPGFNILLTTQKRPFWKDYVLPAGRLREARKGARRADAIIVTKSSYEGEYAELASLGIPFFQTGIAYGDPVYFFGGASTGKVMAVAGLADNEPFMKYVSDHYEVADYLEFKDHHDYTERDVSKLVEKLKGATLITTQKDAVKLKAFDGLKAFNCAYLPIKVKFLKEEERFLQLVDDSLKGL